MNDIKVKKKNDTNIKKIDRAKILTQRLKNNIVDVKDKNNRINNQEDSTPTEYGVNKITNTTKTISNKGINNFNKYGEKSVRVTKQNIDFAKDKIKNKIQNKDIKKHTKDFSKKTNKTIKMLGEHTLSQSKIKTSKVFTNGAKSKIIQTTKFRNRAKEISIKTAKGTRDVVKATFVSIKALATGTKAVSLAILAGGWIIGIIILFICIIAMLISGIVYGQANDLIDYNDERLLKSAIYGTNGSDDIVQVALSQVGNVGGEPYWSWYGFSSRVEWCACFVSFCANECGYIESGVIPKFSSCENGGVKWFKEHNLWQERNYIAKPGDIIFFDWKEKHDGLSDHVGIVEKVENGRVYTIEGNSNDSCKQRDYDINSEEIQGYGTPIY